MGIGTFHVLLLVPRHIEVFTKKDKEMETWISVQRANNIFPNGVFCVYEYIKNFPISEITA